eukprot:gnl/Chilomastix_caulleri/3792.p1 GENE.gnl/Chilomastix_caulleri/3792~~gnl/Chilomastix_caulleri/3792.p1  ORF type:complete len:60 (+),score=13.83 gnl/Chilomastix_caulleri/3792:102-281(+)
MICTCTYIQEIGFGPIKKLLLKEKHGGLGTFYKAAIIGQRLSIPVAILSVSVGLVILLV